MKLLASLYVSAPFTLEAIVLTSLPALVKLKLPVPSKRSLSAVTGPDSVTGPWAVRLAVPAVLMLLTFTPPAAVYEIVPGLLRVSAALRERKLMLVMLLLA